MRRATRAGACFAFGSGTKIWPERVHGERIVAMAVEQLGWADIARPGDGTEPRQKQFQLVRLWELRLEQSALRRLGLRGYGVERDTHNARLRRVSAV
jgi:hypothetical protein